MPVFIPFNQVRITDAEWLRRIDLVREVVLPHQWELLNDRVEGAVKSYCVRNFKAAAGELEAEHGGEVFQDSDLYKWLEAAAYALAIKKDRELEENADAAICLIEKAQQEDGYLNTYYTLKKPGKRYTNLMEGHELYCAGHLMEAAVAYDKACGKGRLLAVSMKLARHLYDTFIQNRQVPGHPEVELALIRLYEHTGEGFCLELAQHFLDARGQADSPFEQERKDPRHEWVWEGLKGFTDSYFQAHKPVREQDTAEGHAVRAMYLYAAMADAARLSGEPAMKAACLKLIDNVRLKRLYVTGGVGSASDGERFTVDYELPNDTNYCETCASIGLMFFTSRLMALTGDTRYYDLWERALLNTALSGMSLDGKRFFYVNPLSVRPDFVRENKIFHHVKPERQSWYGVACCPPNLARTLASLSGSLFAREGDAIFVLAHIAATFETDDGKLSLTREGEVFSLSYAGPAARLCLRIPEGHDLACEAGEQEGGLWVIRHPGGEAAYPYRLVPRLRLVRANPRAAANAGKVCAMRGLAVYCLEEADNGPWLSALYLPGDAELSEVPGSSLDGLPLLQARGLRQTESAWDGLLYTENRAEYEEITLIFAPYRAWGNRGPGEMAVWVNEWHGQLLG